MQTLVLIPVFHERGNFWPFFGMLIVQLDEMIVFFSAPGFDFPLGDQLIFLFDFHIDLFAFFRVQAYDELFLHSSKTNLF